MKSRSLFLNVQCRHVVSRHSAESRHMVHCPTWRPGVGVALWSNFGLNLDRARARSISVLCMSSIGSIDTQRLLRRHERKVHALSEIQRAYVLQAPKSPALLSFVCIFKIADCFRLCDIHGQMLCWKHVTEIIMYERRDRIIRSG